MAVSERSSQQHYIRTGGNARSRGTEVVRHKWIGSTRLESAWKTIRHYRK